MRVIEPQKTTSDEQISVEVKKPKKRLVLLLVLVIAGVGLWSYIFFSNKQNNQQSSSNTNNYQQTDNQNIEIPEISAGPLKIFSGEDFKRLYETAPQVNTSFLVSSPEITGNYEADKRIIKLAEERGYKLSSIPQGSIIKVNEPRLSGDDLLQPLAYDGWQKLKDLAKKDNVPISLNAAYRSVEYQRRLFLERLYATGTNPLMIAQGAGDNAVVATLGLTAVPGYSRHHTGYTIDLWCEDGSSVFAFSSCYKWISANNYLKAKEAGWIPSYPEGTSLQGPEPEPWEYVWVGTDLLR